MKLHCQYFELYDVPVYISLIIYSDNDGGWPSVLERYTRWLMHLTVEEERSYPRLATVSHEGSTVSGRLTVEYDEHIKRLLEHADEHRELEFSVW